jgi:hypothetical protein
VPGLDRTFGPMFASLTTHSTGMPALDARDDYVVDARVK